MYEDRYEYSSGTRRTRSPACVARRSCSTACAGPGHSRRLHGWLYRESVYYNVVQSVVVRSVVDLQRTDVQTYSRTVVKSPRRSNSVRSHA